MEPLQLLVMLPKAKDLSSNQRRFLQENFGSHEDLLVAPDLQSQLSSRCSDLEAELLSLRREVTKRVVVWISRSFAAKSSLRNLNIALEDLGLCTSACGNVPPGVQRSLSDELSRLAKKLRRVESIRRYIDTALNLEALVGDLEDAVNHSSASPFSARVLNPLDFRQKQETLSHAISAMNRIEELLLHVSKFQPQWHQILESVDARVEKTLSFLRPQVIAEHRALLASLGWPPKLTMSNCEYGEGCNIPNPLLLMKGNKAEFYCKSFLILCALQHVQKQRKKRHVNFLEMEEVSLWALDELVLPIASRMEYHFMKWFEQPDYIFALVYRVTRDFADGVDSVLQPLIDRAGLVSCSAKEAWVSAMVQMLLGFLTKRLIPTLLERYKDRDEKSEVTSSWLHLIDLIVMFDKRMKSLINSESYAFLGDLETLEGLSKRISVMGTFCEKSEWLRLWAKIEFKEACQKLREELKGEKVWLTGNNMNEVSAMVQDVGTMYHLPDELKAPLVSKSAVKLAWKLIERSSALPDILARAQFARATACRFLWYFCKILLWQSKENAFSPGSLDESALIMVCGLINTAKYVESKLKEWNDDLHFVEMTIAEINSNFNEDQFERCFFGEEVRSLDELEINWLMEIIKALLSEFEALSREYFQTLESSNVADFGNLTITNDFGESMDTLRVHLQVLERNLSSKDFIDLWRNLAHGIDHFVSRSVFTNLTAFWRRGFEQFGADAEALFLVFRPFCIRPEAFFPCVRETLRLMRMSKEEVKRMRALLLNDGSGSSCLNSLGFHHLSIGYLDNFCKSFY